MIHKHPTLGVFFALGAAILFGLNASTTKAIIEGGITAEMVVFVRALTTFLLALGWALIANPAALKIPLKKIPALLALGVFGVGMLQWAYSVAISLLPIGIALLIEYTAVLMVPIAAIVLFKEHVKLQIWIGAVLVLGGLAVVSQIWDGKLNPTGVIFALIAALSLTTFFLMGERLQRSLPTSVVMTYGMLVATLMFLPFAGLATFDYSRLAKVVSLQGNLEAVQSPLWFLLLWLGVVGAFLPMAFSYLALRHLSATLVGVIATAEILVAFLFAYLWLAEAITLIQALGGIVVLIGILLAQTARRAKPISLEPELGPNSDPTLNPDSGPTAEPKYSQQEI